MNTSETVLEDLNLKNKTIISSRLLGKASASTSVVLPGLEKQVRTLQGDWNAKGREEYIWRAVNLGSKLAAPVTESNPKGKRAVDAAILSLDKGICGKKNSIQKAAEILIQESISHCARESSKC